MTTIALSTAVSTPFAAPEFNRYGHKRTASSIGVQVTVANNARDVTLHIFVPAHPTIEFEASGQTIVVDWSFRKRRASSEGPQIGMPHVRIPREASLLPGTSITVRSRVALRFDRLTAAMQLESVDLTEWSAIRVVFQGDESPFRPNFARPVEEIVNSAKAWGKLFETSTSRRLLEETPIAWEGRE